MSGLTETPILNVQTILFVGSLRSEPVKEVSFPDGLKVGARHANKSSGHTPGLVYL